MKLVLALALFAGTARGADTLLTDELSAIPLGSTLSPKKDLLIRPRTTETSLEHFDDTDGDDVVDYLDWCPKTPAGTDVWEKTTDAKTPEKAHWAGCPKNATPGEDFLRPKSLLPSGYSVYCRVIHSSSEKNRVLKAGLALEVQKYSYKEEKKEDHTVHEEILTLKTPAGGELELTCQGFQWWGPATSEDTKKIGFTWIDPLRTITLKQLTPFFDLKFSPTEEIP